ncbi:MerR family transcriptional regulator [Streptomyces sp. CWNU-52B]|uniref:MerR family transcriptional regulator n=1 Tax=unclassified Streptomyces TaxID=2593676 RepID=UPI0039BEEFBF
MRIGDAAAAAGTTPRALRFYEERGLLPAPRRTATGQREYGPGEVARVRVIRELLGLGLTVEDLRAIADRIDLLVENPRRRCGRAGSDTDTDTDAGSGSGSGSAVVDRRLAALDAEIDRLTRMRAHLALHTYGRP